MSLPDSSSSSDTRASIVSTRREPASSNLDSVQIGLLPFSALALLIGVITGFGAVGFRDLIGFMALVIEALGNARPQDVLGVITKEHVADSVAQSTSVYPIGAN